MNPSQSTPTIRLPMLGQQLNPALHQQHAGVSVGPQQQQQPPPNHNQGGPMQPPPPQSGQDFTLSSVLHFLQTEWRRYERDRNEWEIERAEMRVRHFLCSPRRCLQPRVPPRLGLPCWKANVDHLKIYVLI